MEQSKWTKAGWRIEQKYSNKVLLGNWAEEKLQFTREPKTAKSTNRVDYRPHWDFKPDISERGYALLRAEGLPSKQLFGHYCQPSSHHLVTQYEQSYGTKHNNTLPTLRPWHQDSLTWQAERSERPISSFPTNLLHSTKRCLERQQSHLALLTVYRSSYPRHPLSAFCQRRFARASCTHSTHLHTANHNNMALDLR